MTREEAIEILEDLYGYFYDNQGRDYDEAFRMAIEALQDRPKGDWVPCSERSPKENGEYIVSLEDSVYPWAKFFNGKWFMLSDRAIAREFGEYEVVAWRPRPKPYREDDEV